MAIASIPEISLPDVSNQLHIIMLLSPMGAYVGGQLVSSDRYLDCKAMLMC